MKSTCLEPSGTLKKLMVVVLPGVEDTFTRPLRLKILFMMEDLPTLDLPTKVISGLRDVGTCSMVP